MSDGDMDDGEMSGGGDSQSDEEMSDGDILYDFNQMQLEAHNIYRSYHGVSDLEYDAELA